ncbi:MAG: redoxin domain-containing protein [Saprospiraceae bacterium]|nr:redoxin domain-containing protein [Saprospiraceae bacterium]
MKVLKSLSLVLVMALFFGFTDTNNPFPSINIKTIDGKTVNTNEYTSKGKITVVSFWATWCTPYKGVGCYQ